LDATRIEPDFKLVIAYPANSGVNNDVTIALDVYPIATSLPERELKAVLRSSHSFKAWTTQNCEPKTDSDGVAACVTNQGSPKLIEFLWTASPSSPGLKEFAIQFPSLWHGNEWKAILSKNSDPLMNTRCKEYGEVRRNCLYALVLLSPSTPSYGSSQGEFSVNLSRPEVRFPIKVYATLGVSSYTYSWLALIGVVLSSALGSGWLFKIGDLSSRDEKSLSTNPSISKLAANLRSTQLRENRWQSHLLGCEWADKGIRICAITRSEWTFPRRVIL
jgi:hypothetical protein